MRCGVCYVLFVNNRGCNRHDDDFIFEDFARLRLTGHNADDTEAWHIVAACFVTNSRYIGVQPVCARIF